MKEEDRFYTAYGFLTADSFPPKEQGPHSDAHCLTSRLFFSEFRMDNLNNIEYPKMENFFEDLVDSPTDIEDIIDKELDHKEKDLAKGVTKTILKERAGRFKKYYRDLHGDLKNHFKLKDDYYLSKKTNNEKKDALFNKSGKTSAKKVALAKLRAILELDPQHTYAYQGGGKASPAELGGKGESYTLSKFANGDFEQIRKLVDLPDNWKYLNMDRFYTKIQKKLLRLYKADKVKEIMDHLKFVPAKI